MQHGKENKLSLLDVGFQELADFALDRLLCALGEEDEALEEDPEA